MKYLLIKYTKSILWRVAKRLSYTEDARCLKVNHLARIYIMCLNTTKILDLTMVIVMMQFLVICTYFASNLSHFYI